MYKTSRSRFRHVTNRRVMWCLLVNLTLVPWLEAGADSKRSLIDYMKKRGIDHAVVLEPGKKKGDLVESQMKVEVEKFLAGATELRVNGNLIVSPKTEGGMLWVDEVKGKAFVVNICKLVPWVCSLSRPVAFAGIVKELNKGNTRKGFVGELEIMSEVGKYKDVYLRDRREVDLARYLRSAKAARGSGYHIFSSEVGNFIAWEDEKKAINLLSICKSMPTACATK